MHLPEYTELFRELARRHIAVLATPQNNRFLRILISTDPVQRQLDLSEFYNALRSKLKVKEGESCFVLENYTLDYGDNDGDYLSREFKGAYLVLQKVKLDDFDARDVAIGACETIAEDVLALAVEQLREQHGAYINVRDAWAEHVGPLTDGFVGVRMNLGWRMGATEELTHNPAKFLP